MCAHDIIKRMDSNPKQKVNVCTYTYKYTTGTLSYHYYACRYKYMKVQGKSTSSHEQSAMAKELGQKKSIQYNL